jgi:hypothetical protein
LVGDFATDPSPTEILPKTYRNPLQSGLPKPKTVLQNASLAGLIFLVHARYDKNKLQSSGFLANSRLFSYRLFVITFIGVRPVLTELPEARIEP